MPDFLVNLIQNRVLVRLSEMERKLNDDIDPEYVVVYKSGEQWVTGFCRFDRWGVLFDTWHSTDTEALAQFDKHLTGYTAALTEFKETEDFEDWRDAYKQLRQEWKNAVIDQNKRGL